MKAAVPILFINSATSQVSREVLRKDADREGNPVCVRDVRFLSCPFASHRPCSLNCALLSGAIDDGGRMLLLCRGSGKQVILGMPDPERTDLDEMLALSAASDLVEQKQAAHDQGNG